MRAGFGVDIIVWRGGGCWKRGLVDLILLGGFDKYCRHVVICLYVLVPLLVLWGFGLLDWIRWGGFVLSLCLVFVLCVSFFHTWFRKYLYKYSTVLSSFLAYLPPFNDAFVLPFILHSYLVLSHPCVCMSLWSFRFATYVHTYVCACSW